MTEKNQEPADISQEISNQSILLYFTSPGCQVCKVLKPKVKHMVATRFPRMKIHFIDVSTERETAAHFQVFTVPVILVFFEGKEYVRKSRNFSLIELESEISRPYHLLFEA
jgi:thioredoxin 1